MALAAVATGDPGAPPLVILHGLLGSARNWGTVARALSDRWRVITLDLPNHGASPWSESTDYPFLARVVAAEIEALGRPVALLGHSMGGKVAMVLALSRPDLVERLIVADIAPVAYDHDVASYIRAMRSVPLANASGRGQIEAALAVRVADPAVRALLMHNLDGGPGRYRWRPNLAALLAGQDDILGFPTIPAGCRYGGPALFLAGGRSEYVRPEHHPVIAAWFPAARHRVIAEAGHWLHAEAPAAFVAAVSDFLG